MTSRERVNAVLNRKMPDKIPLDIGGTFATAINALTLYRLRQRFCLPKKTVKVFDPYQMLGELDLDIIEKAAIDVYGVWTGTTHFGTKNRQWKKFDIFPDADLSVGSEFIFKSDSDGGYITFPMGDLTSSPSGRMPHNGHYFDSITRQTEVDEDYLNARADFKNDYTLLTDETLRYIEEKITWLYDNTDLAIIAVLNAASFSDFSYLPAPFLKETPGVRNVEDWLIYYYTHPDYIHEVHQMCLETGIENMKLYKQATGDMVQVMVMSGADYGTQEGLLMSRDMFNQFIIPYQEEANKWVHENTNWKTFYHTCGSVLEILGEMINAGADIINPLQYSAKNMSLEKITREFKGKTIFWGGVIDGRVLATKNTQEVYEEASKNLNMLHEGGPFVAAATHNIQEDTPVENLIAYFQAVTDFNKNLK